MATTSSLFMYSFTLQPPSAVAHAIIGQFAGSKEQQILTASGSRLVLNRVVRYDREREGDEVDRHVGVMPLLTHDVFGIIRSLAPFRLAGSGKGMSLISTSQGFR